jgi:hypothetical protein
MLGFLTPPPDIRQPVIVERDSGGLVSSYQKAVIQYNLENRRVEIRGSCNSACTLALGVKNVCVGKDAIIRWHHAYDQSTGIRRADITREMLSQIPFTVAQRVGPYISVDYNDHTTLNYAQLLQLGIADCDGYNPTVQASVTTPAPAQKTADVPPQQMLGPAWKVTASVQYTPASAPPDLTNSAVTEPDPTEQKKREFDVAYGDAITISSRQNGAPATLRNCDQRRCEDIAAYYDRKGQYVELHKSLNSDNRVICRLSREGILEDDYSCTNWLTGQKLAYHWSRDPLY